MIKPRILIFSLWISFSNPSIISNILLLTHLISSLYYVSFFIYSSSFFDISFSYSFTLDCSFLTRSRVLCLNVCAFSFNISSFSFHVPSNSNNSFMHSLIDSLASSCLLLSQFDSKTKLKKLRFNSWNSSSPMPNNFTCASLSDSLICCDSVFSFSCSLTVSIAVFH